MNFMADDCQYTLKKLLSMVEVIYEKLKFLIISLPQDVTYLDTFLARQLCLQFELRGGDLQILFIKHEDRIDLIQKAFARDKKHFQ